MAEGHNLSFVQWYTSWAEPRNLLEEFIKNYCSILTPKISTLKIKVLDNAYENAFDQLGLKTIVLFEV